MRETRPSGSEGGAAQTNAPSLPQSWALLAHADILMRSPLVNTGDLMKMDRAREAGFLTKDFSELPFHLWASAC